MKHPRDMTEQEIRNLPIQNIIDGWKLNSGELYLVIRQENYTFTLTVPVKKK